MRDPQVQYHSLRDKLVFVSGGGSGIGAALVRAFAGQGARVVFVDIDVATSEALVAELNPRKSVSANATSAISSDCRR
ncbi:3-beta-hydroxysteroid dehydrogenase [Halomonas elongata]|uniref:3-beta-hydroxysteroid dehydrogenase n=1 Tax=Halomonas elongata TaxID=2746 RepID=A0A1B8P0S4_HALEL|nr:3-beta-hydroxysteroid dehydrogenase [Halomonas elongata]